MTESTPRQKRVAMFQMLLCASMWSIAGVFIKQIPWSAMSIAGCRGLVAALTLFICAKISKTPMRITRRAIIMAIFVSGTSLCFVAANKLTTAANAIVLQFTSPVFILLYNVVFLHQKALKSDIAAVALTLGGVALFFFDQLTPGYLIGNCVAICAGIFCAGMYIAVASGSEGERMSGTILGQSLTAAVGIVFSLFSAPPEITGRAVLYIAILGVFQLGLPYMLFLLSARHCPPLACNLLGVMEPLLNPVWVFLFDGEAPGVYALVGAAVVIATITVWSVHQAKTPAPCRK
jgi:drug/metabolite transporter (DMT)-like permease